MFALQISAVLALLFLGLTNAELVDAEDLEKRQNCGINSGYFSKCGGCCLDLGLAGCYAPISGTSTGSWGCYTSPPGLIVSVVSETGPAASTSARLTTTTTRTSAATPASTPSGSTSTSSSSGSSGGSFSCRASQKECGTGCIPLTDTCCPSQQGGCPIGSYCFTKSSGLEACCANGKTCLGATFTSSPLVTYSTTPISTRRTTTGSTISIPTASYSDFEVPIISSFSSRSTTSTTITTSQQFTNNNNNINSPTTSRAPQGATGGSNGGKQGLLESWLGQAVLAILGVAVL